MRVPLSGVKALAESRIEEDMRRGRFVRAFRFLWRYLTFLGRIGQRRPGA